MLKNLTTVATSHRAKSLNRLHLIARELALEVDRTLGGCEWLCPGFGYPARKPSYSNRYVQPLPPEDYV
jgi:hypothetical protein